MALDAVVTEAPKDDAKAKKRDYSDVIKEANERFKASDDRDRDNRENARKDTEFVYIAGKQWPDKWRSDRESADDPCFEFPQLKQFVNQVINEQRQARPGIRVHPAGGKASDEVAEILQGMVRQIEYDSSAEAAYDGGFQHAVVGGRGFWRVVSEYERGATFNQKLCIKRIPDPQTVRMDMDFQEPDGSDCGWYFVEESVQKDDFTKRWPDADALSWSPTDENTGWYEGKDVVIVADYYRRVCTKRALVFMSDGNVGWKDELPKLAGTASGFALPEGVSITKERQADVYSVEWYKVAGGEQVLEEYDCPGSIIPVICCMGDEIMIDGKRIFQGLIRQARDAQILYNFEQSQKVALYALAPRAPWIVAEESIDGFEEWKHANKKNYSHLRYKHLDAEGNPIPPPQRTQYAPVATGWAESAQQSKDDIKAVIGMYQNSLGQHSGETSGRAILAREKQGDNATFHFADNLARAIALTGKIIVGQIPTYYDTERIVSMVAVDDTRSKVTINEQQPSPDNPAQAIVRNDLKVGEYAVVVEAGPSYATKQETTRETLMSLVQSFPPMMQMAGDLIVGNIDFPDADKLAQRLKVMLPPQIQQQIQAEENPQGPPPLPPEVQQQMQGMQQQMQEMGQGIQQLQQENEQLKSGAAQDAHNAELKAQSERESADRDAATAIRKARIDADARVEVARINKEADMLIKAMEPPPEISAAGYPLAGQQQ